MHALLLGGVSGGPLGLLVRTQIKPAQHTCLKTSERSAGFVRGGRRDSSTHNDYRGSVNSIHLIVISLAPTTTTPPRWWTLLQTTTLVPTHFVLVVEETYSEHQILKRSSNHSKINSSLTNNPNSNSSSSNPSSSNNNNNTFSPEDLTSLRLCSSNSSLRRLKTQQPFRPQWLGPWTTMVRCSNSNSSNNRCRCNPDRGGDLAWCASLWMPTEPTSTLMLMILSTAWSRLCWIVINRTILEMKLLGLTKRALWRAPTYTVHFGSRWPLFFS